MIKRGTAVRIEWEDSYNGDHSWQDLSKLPKKVLPCSVKTVGIVLQDNKNRITLCMSMTDEEMVCDLFTIPKGCIKSIKKYD